MLRRGARAGSLPPNPKVGSPTNFEASQSHVEYNDVKIYIYFMSFFIYRHLLLIKRFAPRERM